MSISVLCTSQQDDFLMQLHHWNKYKYIPAQLQDINLAINISLHNYKASAGNDYVIFIYNWVTEINISAQLSKMIFLSI